MSHQFKPGDLALIVGSRSAESPNVGKAVELLQLVSPDERFTTPNGRVGVNACGLSVWVVTGDGITAQGESGRLDMGGICLVHEKYLIPLRGDFAPEQAKSREVPA